MKRKAEYNFEYLNSKKIKIQEEQINRTISLKRKFEDENIIPPIKKQKFENQEQILIEEYYKNILLHNEMLKKENEELKLFINNELEKMKNDNQLYLKSLSINHTNHFIF